MMDNNSVYLSGWTERAGITEGNFGPSGWLQLGLQLIKDGDVVVQPHKIFVGMNLGGNTPEKTAKNREGFKKIQDGGFITLWDLTVDSFVKHGETNTQRRLKGSLARSMITKEGGTPFNLAFFVGRVIQQPTEEWCELQCSYINPQATPEDPPEKRFPKRSIKVFLPRGKLKVKIGHQYFIGGKISSKSPAGKDDLIVVASIANGV